MRLGFEPSDSYWTQLRALVRETGSHSITAVGSATAGAGASTLAASLAHLLAAESDARTLVVDADVCHPAQAELNDVPFEMGLADYLGGRAELGSLAKRTERPPVDVVTAGDGLRSGSIGVEPGDLRRWERSLEAWKSEYEAVVVDCGVFLVCPLALRLTRFVDGVIVAAEWNETRSDVLKETGHRLEHAGATVLGVVLNKRSFVIPAGIYRRM